jgi:hypothetical protein
MAKYEAKTKPTEVSVEDFIASLADPRRREEAAAIDAMMRRVTGEQPRMWGPTMVGYGAYHYRYDSGHEGDAMRIGFSPRKAENVLYVLSYSDPDNAREKALLDRLGKHRRGKTCLYVRKLADVDMDVLEQLSRLSWEDMERRYPRSA